MRRVTTYIIKVWLALLASASFAGCADVFVPSETLAHNEGEHTIVMYLLADNNLSSSIYQNALDAEMGMVGESPATADASGINVDLYKYVHILLGGAVCGLGGAYLSLVYVPY